jgi:hypothetical protein
MLAALLLTAAATAAPAAPDLGLWPADIGAPATEINGIEFYVVEPEDDFWILAVEPLAQAVAKAEEATLAGLAGTAKKLGADAVLLLEELPVAKIPTDPNAPLIGTGAFSAAAYLVFDCACQEEEGPRAYRVRFRPQRGVGGGGRGEIRVALSGRTRR